MRLFIAIDIPQSERDEIFKHRERLQEIFPRGFFVDKDKLHITLVFIGEVKNELKIVKAIEDISFHSFSIKLDRLGTFPSSQGYTYWLGGEVGKELNKLHASLVSNLEKEGVFTEDRKYTMHVTLARKIKERMDFDEMIPDIVINVSEITLFHSKTIDGKLTYLPICVKASIK